MPIVVSRDHHLVVMALKGELNALNSAEVKSALLEHLGKAPGCLIVDLSEVPFIDSSGLGVLVAGFKAAAMSGCKLVLAGLQHHARMIFELTTADRLFTIYPSLDEAISSMAA